LFIGPTVALLNLSIELQEGDDSLFNTERAKMTVALIGLASVLVAVWGLFILYK
jgi:hypothetical protein